MNMRDVSWTETETTWFVLSLRLGFLLALACTPECKYPHGAGRRTEESNLFITNDYSQEDGQRTYGEFGVGLF